jgi:hypothetical protein
LLEFDEFCTNGYWMLEASSWVEAL